MLLTCGVSFANQKGVFVFFFNDTATTEIYPLSLHDALPILALAAVAIAGVAAWCVIARPWDGSSDRKSTRLNSSHLYISYAVFCLKKKNGRPPPGTLRFARRWGARLICGARRARARTPRPGCCGRSWWPRGDPAVFFFFLMTGRPPKSTLFPPPGPPRT